jgi:catechol 2,3-dioxygenase-like lactoylglutathione lyase family enzyme
MKNKIIVASILISVFCFGFVSNSILNPSKQILIKPIKNKKSSSNPLKLGAFSMSLSVKNLQKSKEFYEKLGFTSFGGDVKNNYLIMKNGNALIGLFQGMFEGNILTFNPGWDENAKNVKKFDDIRKIQQNLKENGIVLTSEADEKTKGPASLTLTDPDGNAILLDQHR